MKTMRLSAAVCPPFKAGELLLWAQAELIEKQAASPKPFDDASLLAAMTGMARYVDKKDLRLVLNLKPQLNLLQLTKAQNLKCSSLF
ncbi:MAG: hypothetical protein ACJAUP_000642 [Cellvibrionaceae bacterium]|jgi:hypothetical protein